MKIDRFTQKSIEAVQNMEKVALDYGNQEIEQEHLLYSLLTIEDSLIPKLIEKMGVDAAIFTNISIICKCSHIRTVSCGVVHHTFVFLLDL